MKPLHHFIVHIPQKFKDEIKFGDSTLKLVSKFNEFEHRINQGEIIGSPRGLDHKGKGDYTSTITW